MCACLFPCLGARIHHPLVIAARPYLAVPAESSICRARLSLAPVCLLSACCVFLVQVRLLHLCVHAPVMVVPIASSCWSATACILTPTLTCVILALALRAAAPEYSSCLPLAPLLPACSAAGYFLLPCCLLLVIVACSGCVFIALWRPLPCLGAVSSWLPALRVPVQVLASLLPVCLSTACLWKKL